jgi:hypothetical protein
LGRRKGGASLKIQGGGGAEECGGGVWWRSVVEECGGGVWWRSVVECGVVWSSEEEE